MLAIIMTGMTSGQDIVVTGSWQTTIDASDLTGGPGSDLPSDFPGGYYQIRIDLSKVKHQDWYVTIQRDGTNWPAGLKLMAIRRSNGTGNGWISGGTSLIEVTETPTIFFSGYSDRKTIYVQVGIRNMSVNIPPSVYVANVTYTVSTN